MSERVFNKRQTKIFYDQPLTSYCPSIDFATDLQTTINIDANCQTGAKEQVRLLPPNEAAVPVDSIVTVVPCSNRIRAHRALAIKKRLGPIYDDRGIDIGHGKHWTPAIAPA